MLPFVDDFALFAKSFSAAKELKEVTFALLDDLGLCIYPTKGYHTATQMGDHLRHDENELRAPKTKLDSIAAAAKQLPIRATHNKWWVPVKALASIAGKSRFLYPVIPVAKFYLRELHDIVKPTESWTATIRMSKQLKRDLQWWRVVPKKHNGAPIFKAVETAYIHFDSSGYGWGAVLNERTNTLPSRS